MQKHYHELTKARDRITQVIADEEEKFEKTLANGLAMLNEAIARAKARGTDVDRPRTLPSASPTRTASRWR